MSSRHFHVAAAGEALFSAAQPCPVHPALTFDGLAVHHNETGNGLYTIITLHGRLGTRARVRAYLGPDIDTVERRGSLLAAGLMTNPEALLEAGEAAQVLAWVCECWQLARELLDQVAGPHGDASCEAIALTAGLPLKQLAAAGA